MLDTLFIGLLTDFYAWHILPLHDTVTQHSDEPPSAQIDSQAVLTFNFHFYNQNLKSKIRNIIHTSNLNLEHQMTFKEACLKLLRGFFPLRGGYFPILVSFLGQNDFSLRGVGGTSNPAEEKSAQKQLFLAKKR